MEGGGKVIYWILEINIGGDANESVIEGGRCAGIFIPNVDLKKRERELVYWLRKVFPEANMSERGGEALYRLVEEAVKH